MSAAAPEDVDLQEAARRLGVHYMTAYRYIRTGRLAAHQRGGRWWVAAPDLAALQARTGRTAPVAGPTASRLRGRLVAGDEQGSWQLLESVLVGGRGGARAAVLELLAPAMREVGAAWESGELTVAQEHRATALATRLVGRLSPAFSRPGPNRGSVVLACAPGEAHGLPVALLALFLRGEGYDTVELGADTPADMIAQAAREAGPRLLAVGLSVSTAGRLDDAAAAVRAVRRVPGSFAVLVGGPAVAGAEQARALGADDWASDGAGVAALLEQARRRNR